MVNIYKLKLTKLQQEVLRLLFTKRGLTLNQRQIANSLEVSQPAVKKALPKLEKLDFIKLQKDKETKRWSIAINTDNQYIMQLKRINNLSLIYETKLADFLEKEFTGATIVLFGSYSRGEDNINSDIDFAIVGRKEKNINLERFENILERKININFYESFNKIHKDLKENICNGIVLFGGVELWKQ